MLEKLKALWAKMLGPSVGDTEQRQRPEPSTPPDPFQQPTPGLGPPPSSGDIREP